jgi:5-methylcytosine-specific restriction endonuclease McrA
VSNREPLSSLQKAILEVLKANPHGLDIDELRKLVQFKGNQYEFGRRIRGIYAHYAIQRYRDGRRFIYKYIGSRPEGSLDDAPISKTLRAKILHDYGERCQMCGKTVAEDHIKFHIDHKIPREWGGKTVAENLWPLCSECNEGKKNYFATFDAGLMARILSKKSVHVRIALLLKAKAGEWVDSDLLQFVANFGDFQEDWQRRLREVRESGLPIEHENRRVARRVKSFYRISADAEIPRALAERETRRRQS